MKSGFYVSPCGKHIIQVTAYAGRVYNSMDIDFKGSHIKCDGWGIFKQYRILLMGWELLK